MKYLKKFIQRNSVVLGIAYTLIIHIALVWALRLNHVHECTKPQIEIDESFKETIHEIETAKDKNTIDSLLNELYGFSSK